jgi:hypothetical protein
MSLYLGGSEGSLFVAVNLTSWSFGSRVGS